MKLFYLMVCLVYFKDFVESQTVGWNQDGKMRVSHYDVLVNTYSNKFTSISSFVVPHSYGSNTRISLSITRLHFVQTGASFGIQLTAFSQTASQYNFSVTILDQTVIYTLNIDALTFDSSITQYHLALVALNFELLSKGEGYRSENYTMPIPRSFYNPQGGGVSFAIFPLKYILLNPNGSYLCLNWRKHINVTHYTVEFQTNEMNKIASIGFHLISFDFEYARTNRYQRLVYIVSPTCPGADCLVTVGWKPTFEFRDANKQFWGMSGFNFSKNLQIDWYLATTSYSDMSLGYVQSPGILSIKISGLIMTQRSCYDIDSNNMTGQFFDPGNFQCDLTCPNPPYTYQNGAFMTCSKCHYSCPTCNGFTSSSCLSCDVNHLRYPDSAGVFECKCNSGYVDVGIQLCKKCSDYMPGCDTCSTNKLCSSCYPGLQLKLANTVCSCIDTNKTMTRTGQCIDLRACLSYIIALNGSKMCIQCNINNNFSLNLYKCSCYTGFQMTYAADGITPVCIQFCGNGKLTQSQACDDGNYISGDGCNYQCIIEPSYACFAELTDTSFCLKDYAVLTYYKCLKNQKRQNAIDIYFSFFPYEQKFMKNLSFFQSLLYTSLQESTQFTDFIYHFYEKDKKQIRFILSVKYDKQVNISVQNLMRFKIWDTTKVKTLEASVLYKLQSKTYPLHVYLQSISAKTYWICSFILLACIIGAYLIATLSVFTQNWIGIQLLHTFQFMFFYFFLFDEIDGSLAHFISILKYSTGFNVMRNSLSLFEYYMFDDKLFLFKYGKEFLLNFNYSALLFVIPLLLVIGKFLIPPIKNLFGVKKSKRYPYKMDSNKVKSKIQNKNTFFSTQFIVGKVTLSIVLVMLFPILLSFFIEQSYHATDDQTFNQIGVEAFIFGLMTIEFSILGLLYIDGFKRLNFVPSVRVPHYTGTFNFKRFKPLYPLVYVFFQISKFILLILLYDNTLCVYLILGIDTLCLVGYCVFKPYAKQRDEEVDFCYLLHNLHNIFNTLGLVGFLIIIMICNLQDSENNKILGPIILFYLLGVGISSITLAVTRVFLSKRLLKCRSKQGFEQDESQDLDNFENYGRKLHLQKGKKRLRINSTESKQMSLRKQIRSMRKGAQQKMYGSNQKESKPFMKQKPGTQTKKTARLPSSRTVVKVL